MFKSFWDIIAGILWRWDMGPNFRLGAVVWFGFLALYFYVTTYVWGV